MTSILQVTNFHPPIPLDNDNNFSSIWSKSTPLDASHRPNGLSLACPQLSWSNNETIVAGTEDCLKLHVYTPNIPSDDDDGLQLPVLVWIHGGGFIAGDAWGYSIYDGIDLVVAENVVVVSIQYRLGLLGFLVDDQLGDNHLKNDEFVGNYGLLDQQEALRWIQANIASFGGDPNKVTIFGESAGGMSVCYHLVSPQSVGLFHRAIMQSGSCDMQGIWETAKFRQQWWRDTLLQETDCTHFLSSFEDDNESYDHQQRQQSYVQCLKHLDVSILVNSPPTYLVGPAVGGAGLPDWPHDLMKQNVATQWAKISAAVPSVIFTEVGNPFQYDCRADQDLQTCGFLMYYLAQGGGNLTDSILRQWLENGFVPWEGSTGFANISNDQWQQIVDMYPLSQYQDDLGIRDSAILSDAMNCHKSFSMGQCGLLRSLEIYTQYTGGQGWAASFEQLGHKTLVGHGDDESYTFLHPGKIEGYSYSGFSFIPTMEDNEISRQLAHYWANFARTGFPGEGWQHYDATTTTPIVAAFHDTTVEYIPAKRRDFCDYWRDLNLPDLSMYTTDRRGGGFVGSNTTGAPGNRQLVMLLVVMLVIPLACSWFWRRQQQQQVSSSSRVNESSSSKHQEDRMHQYATETTSLTHKNNIT